MGLTRVAFVDVDYIRAAHANGHRRVITSGPETWAFEQSGIVWGKVDLDNREPRLVTGAVELVTGPDPVTTLFDRLATADLIVGHGLLNADFRAAAMVAELPSWLVGRTVDTLDILTQVRSSVVSSSYPTGLNLSDLAAGNLSGPRRKAARWTPATRAMRADRRGDGGRSEGSPDARDDALVVSKLWSTLITVGAVTWGAGQPGYSSAHGHGWTGKEGGTAALSKEALASLRGATRANFDSWDTLARMTSVVAVTSAIDLAGGTQRLDAIWAGLAAGGFVGNQSTQEALLTGLQFMGANENATLRDRLVSGKNLTQTLRKSYAWGLFQSQHPEMIKHWSEASTHRHSARGGMHWLEVRDTRQNLKADVEQIGREDA